MPPESRLVEVKGRRVSFATWGEPDGFPVVSCHGTPGGRLNRHPDDDVYTQAGAWLVTYDRPGYGWSDRLPGRCVADCVSDVRAVVGALGIDEFAVTGSSGGAPHALAVAALMGSRVIRARSNAGVAPFDAVDFFSDMDPMNVVEFRLAQQGADALALELEPQLAAMVERGRADAAHLLGDTWTVDQRDRDVLADPATTEVLSVMLNELERAGVWGWADDDVAMVEPWGFDPRAISIPVEVSFGLRDTLVPTQHGRWLAANIPGCREVITNDGHLSTPADVIDRVRSLVAGW